MGEKTTAGKIKLFLIFAGPAVLMFTLVVVIPFLYGIYLTFTSWDGISASKPFVGFSNYVQVFKDAEFWKSMWLTIKFVAVSVILINVVAFLLAYVLTSGIKAQNFLRSGFFIPNLIGGVVLGFIWNFVFSRVLVSFGQTAPFFLESWLTDPTKAFWAMVVVTIWQYSGYMMLIYVAGFTGLSQDLLEAASIDGCTGWQKLKNIVLPLMVPSFVICLFLSLQRCFMVYDVNLSLTAGGPYGTTRMVAMHVYQKAFLSKAYGVGQAEAFVLFIVVAIISMVQIYTGKSKEVDA